jgi:hypothetical protein
MHAGALEVEFPNLPDSRPHPLQLSASPLVEGERIKVRGLGLTNPLRLPETLAPLPGEGAATGTRARFDFGQLTH